MSRLMSVALTEHAVIERRKTVTRRLGWWEDKRGRRIIAPGDHLTLCRKVMGRSAGEPLVRVAEVEIVDIRREPLSAITDADVIREGFPDRDAAWFVTFFTREMHCPADVELTRIEWRYLDLARADGELEIDPADIPQCTVGDCGCPPEAMRGCPGRYQEADE